MKERAGVAIRREGAKIQVKIGPIRATKVYEDLPA